MNSGGGRRLPELGIGLGPMRSNGYSSPSPSSVHAQAPPPPPPAAECVVREQDRFMPIANVIRIMRKILPAHAKISDDGKETIQECVSEFISFITGEANERCQREQRKTITAEDILWAMSKLGFDDYIEPLTLYLHRHRQVEGVEHSRGSGVRAAASSASAIGAGDHQHYQGPPAFPLSPPTGFAARPPLARGRYQPQAGFFIPTPATPGNGHNSSTTSTSASSSNNNQ